MRRLSPMLLPLVGLLGLGCSDSSTVTPDTTIAIGVSLPFTGKEAAMGRNIEQAMLLAVEDINRAGGVDGVPISLASRDSNSGSARGLSDLLSLLYDDKVAYLIGPEENDLASEIVADVKKLNVLNILPGYAAPSILRSTTTGAWMRLAPSPHAMGCGLAMHAVDEGVQKANTLSSLEDYNASVSSAFNSIFRRETGHSTPGVTIQTGQSSYASPIRKVLSTGTERTLLIAYPGTAANVVTEWSITNPQGFWYLSPLLHADVFLSNIPYGALDGFFGMSPSLSLASECELLEGEYPHGAITCRKNNSDQFAEHFAHRWDGTKPFPAANLYYDAVVLLAMGLQYAHGTGIAAPNAKQVHQIIRKLNRRSNHRAFWHSLGTAMSELSTGSALRYIGAGAEYDFDEYGAAEHVVFDTWTIKRQAFVSTGPYFARCMKPM